MQTHPIDVPVYPEPVGQRSSQLPTQTPGKNQETDLTKQQQDPKKHEQSDERGFTAQVEGEHSSEEDDNHLHTDPVILAEVPDSSICNHPSYLKNRNSHSSHRLQSGKPIGGNGNSEDDEDVDDDEEHLNVYDSDLDSILGSATQHSHSRKMRKWKSLVKGRFEKMLLDCIVNTDNIAPNYRDVFIDPSIINKLEQVTSLSLLRPKAFSCGVLKGNKVTGCILYGPPGTGKSMLARGMAKQSGFNMLSISTSEIWQAHHGEDEKMIKAIFSLARKLYPCIVFVDEADAMLGTRKADEIRHIRSMLNQFLMEWDGLVIDTKAPFVLLATNRPLDLDPAVLRRAPVQIHLNIPTQSERAGILDLLLEGETLQHINTNLIARLTPKYTGSNLKNLCVMAATNCVNSQPNDTTERILTRAHFYSALQTISATNMGKLSANEFKKFEGRLEKNVEDSARGEDEDQTRLQL
ncbi:P-loop containing nucleoside triphosphate hydrolase protein [Colletotrichum godetiae]|uniref:P-loop containing nucleoside triphosphate hydrolase protein n=1 Tax=Colletotrichum godetiae TaxID=1209918 RepID=A0AAJ0AW40_9PEZI|nr:P-loop containing nucleoside triphosphate hydrolase protein [Colletotrichum godetiae]KAK1691447.1 P-loop containing nucleoside triphosphate hydrolase protein [Colletotrichum godetiae]